MTWRLQPLNYTGHAIAAYRRIAEAFQRKRIPQDASTALWLASELERSVHFVVPHEGRIFDDGLKGIQGSEIRLPYPAITIEYQSKLDPDVEAYGGTVIVKCSRRPQVEATRI